MEIGKGKINLLELLLIITAVLHADLTPQILRYNEEKDRKVIEYVEDWLSHIEWTNQDVVG